MGNTHLGCYDKVDGTQVVALADIQDEKLRPGESAVQFNIGTAQARIDPARHRLYDSADDLIADPDVDMVDICLPTFLHAEFTEKALRAGKHVLCEKPMALTYAECQAVLHAARQARGKLMIAQCVRFFPAYEYLSETAESGRLGRLMQLSLWRGSSPPRWSWQDWLLDHKRSGGGILDLHVHDADFVQHVLGHPRAVCSTGARGPSGGYDAVDTQYIYQDQKAVRAAGNLAMPAGYGFEASFLAAFEKGSLAYSSAAAHGLTECTEQGAHHPSLPDKDGYVEEIAYFARCIQHDERPAMVTPESSAFSVRLAEAERESIETGRLVELA
jgi:predicted dehydrogenase